jgi:sec-independent protein translocase protein TatA
MLKNIGTTELVILLLILLFLFGGRKIPEFIRGISKGIEEYRKASKDK